MQRSEEITYRKIENSSCNNDINQHKSETTYNKVGDRNVSSKHESYHN